jgi:RHS repeat-associated protein
MDRADIADVNGNSNTTEVLRFHYHQQALGSVTELTQPSGAVVEWVTYDVYGLPTIRNQVGTAVTQSAVGNAWLFTGREYDPESGLYFYRARTYDPGTGRFLQRDPAGYPDGLSAHEFTRSSPVHLTDPLGLDTGKVNEARSKWLKAEMAVGRALWEEQEARMQLRQAENDVAAVRNSIEEQLKREPRSGVLPCRQWKKWARNLHRLEEDLQDALAKVEAAEALYDKAFAQLMAARAEEARMEDAYWGAVAADLADNGLGAFPGISNPRADVLGIALGLLERYGPEWVREYLREHPDQSIGLGDIESPGETKLNWPLGSPDITIRRDLAQIFDSRGHVRINELQYLVGTVLHELRHCHIGGFLHLVEGRHPVFTPSEWGTRDSSEEKYTMDAYKYRPQ